MSFLDTFCEGGGSRMSFPDTFCGDCWGFSFPHLVISHCHIEC